MSDLILSQRLRDLLASNLLEERDLVEAVALSDVEELSDRPGKFGCRCVVPVRRPFDPETAELRRLDLMLSRHSAGGWEVETIEGLVEPD